ncbi:MAG: histidine phosphatase family protein [Acidimicrobiales bacterium]|jgi:probable phosphoglycerate mutase
MLILVRHGESTGNAEGLLLGRIDAPLTDRGVEQARSVGSVLHGVTRVICSPLGRARQTADELGLGLAVEVDDRWIEADYGELDGRPLATVPPEVWRQWRSDPDFRPPGGETLAEVGVRIRSACEELFAADGEGARGGGHVLVVSHVSPIKAATCWSLGLPDQGAWRLYLATASITRIGQGPGGVVLRGYNDTPWAR